jgi:hypothetical protein
MERNIFVVKLVIFATNVTFQNNVSNFPEVFQLEHLACFLGFQNRALQDVQSFASCFLQNNVDIAFKSVPFLLISYLDDS